MDHGTITWSENNTGKTLTYKTVDGDWLKEVFNADLNLIKRTTSFGDWAEYLYVRRGKAKGKILSIKMSGGVHKTFKYDDAGKLIRRG